jgi:hypothetical protein
MVPFTLLPSGCNLAMMSIVKKCSPLMRTFRLGLVIGVRQERERETTVCVTKWQRFGFSLLEFKETKSPAWWLLYLD